MHRMIFFLLVRQPWQTVYGHIVRKITNLENKEMIHNAFMYATSISLVCVWLLLKKNVYIWPRKYRDLGKSKYWIYFYQFYNSVLSKCSFGKIRHYGLTGIKIRAFRNTSMQHNLMIQNSLDKIIWWTFRYMKTIFNWIHFSDITWNRNWQLWSLIFQCRNMFKFWD